MDNLLQTPPLTTGALAAVETMVQDVADLIGGAGDPDVRAKAIRMLDRAADRMNASGVYLFRRKEASFTSFTNGQSTLTPPSDWAFATDPMTCFDSLSRVNNVVEWKSWEIYRQQLVVSPTNINGVPSYATQLSEMDATIYLYPYIDSSKVSTIKATYFARILRISELTDANVYLTREAAECLVTGGMALMTQNRFLSKPAIWGPMMADFDRMIQATKQVAFRNQQAEHMGIRPDESGNLASSVYTPGPQATVFIGF